MTMAVCAPFNCNSPKFLKGFFMSNLGVGIIGCGDISTAYLELAQLFSGIQIRALDDINDAAAIQKIRGT